MPKAINPGLPFSYISMYLTSSIYVTPPPFGWLNTLTTPPPHPGANHFIWNRGCHDLNIPKYLSNIFVTHLLDDHTFYDLLPISRSKNNIILTHALHRKCCISAISLNKKFFSKFVTIQLFLDYFWLPYFSWKKLWPPIRKKCDSPLCDYNPPCDCKLV